MQDKSNIHLKFVKTNYESQEAILVLFKDVSLFKEYEKVKYETKFKSILMTTITHELRTPVNGILGMIQVLKQCANPESLEYLLVAESSCHLLINLINDILVLSNNSLFILIRIIQNAKKGN